MRITNTEVHRKYISGLHRNYRRHSDSQNRVISQRKFTRASQNPLEAAKALKNRKAISEVETYKKNLETAAGIYSAAEEAVRGISGIMQTLQEKLIAGAHGTFNVETDKQIIAEEIDHLANQMVRLMNLIIADRRIFGGVNNSSQAYEIKGGPPGGTVFFNGVDVNMHSDPSAFPFGEDSFLDAGLGMKFFDDGYTIDPQSAIAVTFNGAKILGCGMRLVNPSVVDVTSYTGFDISSISTALVPPVDGMTQRTFTGVTVNGAVTNVVVTRNGDGVLTVDNPNLAVLNNGDGTFSIHARASTVSLSMPVGTLSTHQINMPGGDFSNNIIQLTLDAAKSVRAGTDDLTALFADLVFAAGSSLSMAIASLGTEQAFIEFNQERLTNNMFTLLQRENELEYIDIGEELINQKILEMIYNATLQISASTIPMSIFNFMR